MKILIVYDTTSVNRNTKKVAKAISEVLKKKVLTLTAYMSTMLSKPALRTMTAS